MGAYKGSILNTGAYRVALFMEDFLQKLNYCNTTNTDLQICSGYTDIGIRTKFMKVV